MRRLLTRDPSRDFPRDEPLVDRLSPWLRLNLGPEIEKRNHLDFHLHAAKHRPTSRPCELDQLRALLERFGFPPDGICPRLDCTSVE